MVSVTVSVGAAVARDPAGDVLVLRPGLSLAKRPPSTRRVHLSYGRDEVARHAAALSAIDDIDDALLEKLTQIVRSGDHAKLAKWKRQQALRLTRERRPDLFALAELKKGDLDLLGDGGE